MADPAQLSENKGHYSAREDKSGFLIGGMVLFVIVAPLILFLVRPWFWSLYDLLPFKIRFVEFLTRV